MPNVSLIHTGGTISKFYNYNGTFISLDNTTDTTISIDNYSGTITVNGNYIIDVTFDNATIQDSNGNIIPEGKSTIISGNINN